MVSVVFMSEYYHQSSMMLRCCRIKLMRISGNYAVNLDPGRI